MYRHVVECFKSSQSQLELMSIILITKVYLGILVTKISHDFKMTESKNTVDIIEKHGTCATRLIKNCDRYYKVQ